MSKKSTREYNVNCQFDYNPYGIDPTATSGQVSLFGGPGVQIGQNNGPGVAAEVDVIGAIEIADGAGDIVNAAISGGCCVIS